MLGPSVLITGGNGYLGLRLAKRVLESTDYAVQLFVHAADNGELAAKTAHINEKFSDAVKQQRLVVLGGELSANEPFAEVQKERLEQIIHSAAVTRFNVEEDLANRINIEGTEKLLSFACRCADLSAVQLLSTVYASGLRTGVVYESPLDRALDFSNHYERSKWESEQLVSRFKQLPLNIIRIATLISDNDSGVVTQQNAFHNTLKLFYYGLLSLFPGEKNTPIYFVTGDFVVESIMQVFGSGKVGEFFHVCHSKEESASLEQLVDTVFDTFESYADFKVRRVLRPLWSDAESFDLLSQGIGSMSSGVMAQAVSSVAPFSRQLFAAKDFRNDNLKSIMGNYHAPDPIVLIAGTAKYLADTKWGRQVQHAI